MMSNSPVFKIIKNNNKAKTIVIELLHEYPNHFIQGLFEPAVEEDFQKSKISIAYLGEQPVGCLIFYPETNEFNWLAVKRGLRLSKTEIARGLFKNFYHIIEQGVKVHLFVNTEDAYIPGYPLFSGKNFEPARRFYKSMGLEIKEDNRIENKYGPGAHVYKVEWVPNKI